MKPFASIIGMLVMFAALAIHSPVRADSMTTWTTTDDFDLGDKGTVADSTPGSWTTVAPMPQPTGDSAGIAYGGEFYVAGGYQNGSTDPKDYLFRHTPSTDTWASLTAMPTARWNPSITTWADRIYVMGGADAAGAAVNANEYYNVTASTWTPVTNLPAPITISGACAATWGDYIWITGAGTIYRYDPGLDSYAAKTGTVSQGTGHTCATKGLFLYVISGTNAPYTNVARYSFSGDSWMNPYDTTPLARYGATFYHHAVNLTSESDGNLYMAVGLVSNNRFFTDTYSYEPAGKLWTLLEPAKWPRDGVASAMVNGRLYVTSGRDATPPPVGLAFHEVFDPTGTTLDGVMQVETTTDNPAIIAGQFEIASEKGDSFSFDDRDAYTMRWFPLWLSVGGGACDVNIDNGYLTLDSQTAGSSCSVASTHSYSGDLDARIRMTRISGTPGKFMVFNERVRDYGATGTNDGLVFQANVNGANLDLATYKITNGAFAVCTGSGSVTGYDTYLRITFVGATSTWTSYKGSTLSGPWTQVSQCVNAITGPWYTVLNGVGLTKFRYDDYSLPSGTVTHRTSGAWTSPTISVSGAVKQVTWTATGTSPNCVDKVEILQGGAMRETYDPSGCAASPWIPNQNIDGQVSVKITLAGSGTATPVLEEVSLEYGQDVDVVDTDLNPLPDVEIMCDFHWPWMEVRCDATERVTPGSITDRAWFVNGRRQAGENGTSFTYVLPQPGHSAFEPLNETLTVKYVITVLVMRGTTDLSALDVVPVNTLWLWLIYILTFVFVGLWLVDRVVRRSARMRPSEAPKRDREP